MRGGYRARRAAGRGIGKLCFVMLLAAGQAVEAQPADGQGPSPALPLPALPLPLPDSGSVMIEARPWTVLETLPPAIRNAAVVEAPVEQVWQAWTTRDGVKSFLGLDGEVEARPGGLFRVIYQPGAATPQARGNDGRVLAIEPMRMLSVTWMTPMHMKALAGQSTVLTLYFSPVDGGRRTRVELINTGYGTGALWREAHAYNVKGWDRVMSGLEARFRHGPLPWDRLISGLKAGGGLPYWREHLRKADADK